MNLSELKVMERMTSPWSMMMMAAAREWASFQGSVTLYTSCFCIGLNAAWWFPNNPCTFHSRLWLLNCIPAHGREVPLNAGKLWMDSLRSGISLHAVILIALPMYVVKGVVSEYIFQRRVIGRKLSSIFLGRQISSRKFSITPFNCQAYSCLRAEANCFTFCLSSTQSLFGMT